MKKSKIRNIIEKSLYVILGVIAVIGIGFGFHKLYNSLFKVEMVEVNSNWTTFPPNYENYSQNHSYKIQLRISDTKASNGTAWSWYWKQQSDSSFDWYLITNFHVVNEAIAYNLNLTTLDSSNNVIVSDINALLESYHNQYKFTFSNEDVKDESSFSLYRWNTETENGKYIPLLDQSARNCLKEISIIADFENDSIDLFSKLNNQNNDQDYNLDMALIKMTFDFSDYINHSIPNYSPVWNFQNSSTEERIYNENLQIFIAGHPSAAQKLVGVEIDSTFIPDYKNLETIDDPILKKLKAPYLYSSKDYRNFPLSGGASGSAVYQDINYPINSNPNPVQTIDWTKKVPVGIYWGGQLTSNIMKPSFIPFIVSNQAYGGYDIFKNFIEAINSSKI